MASLCLNAVSCRLLSRDPTCPFSLCLLCLSSFLSGGVEGRWGWGSRLPHAQVCCTRYSSRSKHDLSINR